MSKPKQVSVFTRFAKWAARATGKPAAFIVAASIIVLWALSGPIFDFSDTWQLVINTGTTIITFTDGISHSEYAKTVILRLQIKWMSDTSCGGAQNTRLDLEEMDEKETRRIRAEYEEWHRSREKLQNSKSKKTTSAKAKHTR